MKSVKFKTTILEILANHQSIVVTFAEKIAVFDARTLEDRLTITTCHPSPGLSPNPVALGPRWLAYAERKMMSSKRSAGGCDCDGVSSYTATMLNAAKTLSKGLRELGEQVAAGLSGTVGTNVPTSTTTIASNNGLPEAQQLQPGVITILDIKVSAESSSICHSSTKLSFRLSFNSIQSKKLVRRQEHRSHCLAAIQLLHTSSLTLTSLPAWHSMHPVCSC